ncbi:MAG: hypothetical protein JJD92_06130 [Frankiaceae bacterium]|nr:hypothetical protein [Frankiaceae bacterium]
MMSTCAASAELRNEERLARLTIQMAYNVRLEHAVAAHRTINRMSSALGVMASVVAVYDLSLLAMQ